MSEQLESWVQRLVNGSMPIFTRTVQAIAATAGRDDSSFSELAWSILQDPGLTAQVLKLSNGIYYNPSGRRINTVSRALMRLGFKTVREMCLSIALVESVLANLHRDKVALEIARAFHSAAQAKNIAVLRQLPSPEEVFIAALLSRIGQIAFWFSAGELGDRLELALRERNEPEEKVEMEVLWLPARAADIEAEPGVEVKHAPRLGIEKNEVHRPEYRERQLRMPDCAMCGKRVGYTCNEAGCGEGCRLSEHSGR